MKLCIRTYQVRAIKTSVKDLLSPTIPGWDAEIDYARKESLY